MTPAQTVTVRHCKGPLEIFPPGRTGQDGLGNGWPGPEQQVGRNAVPELGKKTAGQEKTLIETTLPKPGWMERHRHNHLRDRELPVTG